MHIDCRNVAAGSLPPVSADASIAVSARLDAVIDRALAEERIVGSVVLAARNGEVIYRRAAGLMDREAGTPMRDDAIFRFASVTKPIVSVAVLSLIERGMLHLDEPVTRTLPEFRPRVAEGTEPVITVRQLLTHTAGLTYGFLHPEDSDYRRAGVSDGMDQPGLALSKNLERLASLPLAYAPGTRWGYSLATDVLGEVIARARGISLPEVVRETVTGPLGMSDTGFSVGAAHRLTIPYGDGFPRPVRMGERHEVKSVAGALYFAPGRILDHASYPSGGAGMAGTADDLLTFLECLRRGGAPILTPASSRGLTNNAVGDLPVDLAGPGWGFGLGVAVLDDPVRAATPQSRGTWGWSGAYGHSWFVDPQRKLTLVALTNTAIAGMIGAYPDAIRDALCAD